MAEILNMSFREIIRAALRDAQIIPVEQAVEPVDLENGIERINIILKQLQSQGLHLWTKTEAIIPLNKGQRMYTLGPDGDEIANDRDFFNNALAADQVATDTVLTLIDTDNIDGAADIFLVDPVLSTANWEAGNDAILSVTDQKLTLTNGSALAGFADLTLDTNPGDTYIVTVGFELGTSVGMDAVIQDFDGVISTTPITSTSTTEITFVARQIETTLTAQNQSAVLGEDFTLNTVNYIEKTSGDRIGIELDDGTRQWTNVVTVDSSSQVTISDSLTGDAATNNTVYTFTDLIPRPMRLLQVRFGERYTFTEIPTNQWARSEYFEQPDKDSSGTIVHWYYDPQLRDGELFVWQVAANVRQVLRFTYTRPINVSINTLDDPDVPAEWFGPLKWALAAEMGPMYGVKMDRQVILNDQAASAMGLALDYDIEPSSMNVQPDFGFGWSR